MSLRFDPSLTTSTSIQSTSSGTTTPSITGSTGSDVFDIKLGGNATDEFESNYKLCFGGDRINLDAGSPVGGVESDTIRGGAGNDTVYGGSGNDVI